MTNEELTVLARLADELVYNRDELHDMQEQRNRFAERTNCLDREKSELVAECNRLRESEANALNAAEEAKRERDEARTKLGELAQFVQTRVHDALCAVRDSGDVDSVIRDIRTFQEKHPLTVMTGGMAK